MKRVALSALLAVFFGVRELSGGLLVVVPPIGWPEEFWQGTLLVAIPSARADPVAQPGIVFGVSLSSVSLSEQSYEPRSKSPSQTERDPRAAVTSI